MTVVDDEPPRPAIGGWVGRLLLGFGLAVAVLPSLLAGHRALDEHWRPVLDNERLAVDAASFARGHPPLLGAHSTSLEVETHITPVHHLGPSEAWLFGAVQAGWPGPGSLVVSAAALAAAASAVIVLAMSRIGGPWAGLAAGAITGLVAGRLGTPILADIWNPNVPILPLAAAVTAAWASAVARFRPGLALAVFFGTVAAQAHLTHAPLVAVAVAPALAAAWLGRRACAAAPDAADQQADAVHPDAIDGRRVRLWSIGAVVALAIGLILWFPPILSEATAGHSNLVNLWRAATHDTGETTLGLRYGLAVFGRVLGQPPPFGPPATGFAVWAVPIDAVMRPALRVLSVLLPVVVVLIYGARRRDRMLLVIGASVLATDLAALLLLSISTYSSGAALYQTRWLWSIAILHWGAIALAALRAAQRLARTGQHRFRGVPLIAVTGVMSVLAVAATFGAAWPHRAAGTFSPSVRVRMASVADLQARLGPELHRHRRFLVQADALVSPATNVALDLAATLITERVDVKITSADHELRKTFGGRFAASPGDGGELLVVTDGLAGPLMTRRGFEPVAATPLLTSAERHRLRSLVRQVRAQLAGSVRWSTYGAFVHAHQPAPDVGKLLRDNELGEKMYDGELAGWLPSAPVMERLTDLERRSRPQTSFVVWHRRGPNP